MSDVKSWEIPDVGENKVRQKEAGGFRVPAPEVEAPPVVEEVETYRAPTAEELTKLYEQTKQEAYEEGLAQGREQGYEQGYAKGHEEGLSIGREAGYQAGDKQGYEESSQRGQEDIRQQVQTLQSVIRQLNQPLAQQEEVLEKAMVALALQVASAVIQQEVRLDTERVASLIRSAIHALPHGGDYIQVLLHPEDATLISQSHPDLLKDASVKPDPTISRGGVIVKTNQSLIDLTLDRAWQQQVVSILEQAELSTQQQSLFDHNEQWSAALSEESDESTEPSSQPLSSADPRPPRDSGGWSSNQDGGADVGSSGPERDGRGPLSD